MYPSLTIRARVEDVVVDVVVPPSETDADAVLDVGEGVIVDLRVEGLQHRQAGVVHVVHVVT